MRDSGVAIMGMGMAAGEDRALKAIENALASPLLNSNDITGAKSILVNILSGIGANELTMDELGQITDYMYDAASEDALIIRGLSQDGNLGENISVTVIATGFPGNTIFTPYKKPKPKKVELLAENNPFAKNVIPDKSENDFTVHPKSSKSVIDDIDEKEKPEATLKKVKHMQNFFKKEDLSNKIIKENIENFEDVPAYIRKKINLQSKEEKNESEESMGTPQPDEENESVLIENNPYLNTLEKKEVKTDKTNLKKIKNEQKTIKKGNIIKKNFTNDYNDLKDIPVKIGQKKSCGPGEKRTRSNSDSTLQKDNEVQEIDFQNIEKQVFDNINETNPYDFNHGIESGFQDLVYSSVFAPEHVIRNKNLIILVFIHTRDQKAEVKSLARNFDKNLIQKAFQYLDLNIKIGTLLTFELILNNISVEENKKTLVWLGDPSYIDFEFIIPESFEEILFMGK